MSRINKKLLVFDVEGTIFKAKHKQVDGVDYASTMWQPLAYALGEDAVRKEKELADKWDAETFERYSQWVSATAEMHKEKRLTESTFNKLIQEAEYEIGVVDFFKSLDREKHIPILVSGGFQELVDRAMHELNIKHGYGACKYTFDEEGILSSYSISLTDYEWKIPSVEQHINDLNLDFYSDWIFVGDGKNDCFIADAAPVAYAINGHPELLAVENIKEISDFYELSKLISNLNPEDFRFKINNLLINPRKLQILSKMHGYLYACTAIFQQWLSNTIDFRLQNKFIDDEYYRVREVNKKQRRPVSIGAADFYFLLNACIHSKKGTVELLLTKQIDAYKEGLEVNRKISSFLNNLISNMRAVRNDWSHIQHEYFPSNSVIQNDLKTIIYFLECFGDKRAVSPIVREIEDWIKLLT